MITATKQYRTETGHRLAQYSGKCSHVHGHSYLWEVTATAQELTHNGMVVDFKDLKHAMERVLEPFDHAMLLWEEDPLVKKYGEGGVQDLLLATNGEAPRLFILGFNPTAENLAAFAGKWVQNYVPTHIKISAVRVWETASSFAEWRPL